MCRQVALVAIALSIVALPCRAGNPPNQPPGRNSSDDPEARGGDMWSMVASMRESADTNPFGYRQSVRPANGSLTRLDWRLNLDGLHWFELEWRVEYDMNEIVFAINIDRDKSKFRPGHDLFALGFSPDGRHQSSDYCLIWYDLGHRVHIQNARTDSNNRLETGDASESVCRFVSESAAPDAQRTRGQSSIQQVVFSRPLDVCKAPRGAYYAIDNGTTHLVWFALKGPLLSVDGLNLSAAIAGEKSDGRSRTAANGARAGHAANERPANRAGMRRVQLVAAGKPAPETDGHSSAHEIRMDKFAVPASETTYWCRLFKLPRRFQSRRFHITRYEAVVEPENEHVVHHMELFSCANLTPEQARQLEELHESRGGWQGECSARDRPRATDPCRKVVLAWAMGAQPLVYPRQVGQAIGGRDSSPFVVLEVHYNNVRAAAGLVDSSGLRFHYTSRLRPFDAGILEVGLEYSAKNSIPPGLVTPLAGHCPGECTRLAMGMGRARGVAGGDGIWVFAGQMHTHLSGVASWTEQVRAGELVRELQRDDHYSPHFQEIRLLAEPVRVEPGDSLIHYCLYDTRARANITLGGFATTDEMCVTYLHYYPRIELEVCKSSVDSRALAGHFARLSREESQPLGESVAASYRAIEWSARRSRELVEFYAAAPLSVQCNQSDGRRFPGRWDGIAPPAVWPPRGGGALEYRGRGHGRRHARCSPGA